MSGFMQLETIAAFKRLLTLIARKWLFTRISHRMTRNLSVEIRRFVTLNTDIIHCSLSIWRVLWDTHTNRIMF